MSTIVGSLEGWRRIVVRFNPLSVFMFLLWASISKAFHNYSLGAIFLVVAPSCRGCSFLL